MYMYVYIYIYIWYSFMMFYFYFLWSEPIAIASDSWSWTIQSIVWRCGSMPREDQCFLGCFEHIMIYIYIRTIEPTGSWEQLGIATTLHSMVPNMRFQPLLFHIWKEIISPVLSGCFYFCSGSLINHLWKLETLVLNQFSPIPVR